MGLSRPRHILSELRRVLVLVFLFVVFPSSCLLSVGILVLVFGHTSHDVVFGVLILSLVATMGIGSVAMLVYLFRGATLARLQTDFVAKVSHDLRTPLTSIRMFVETLQLGRAGEPEKTRECLAVIHSETERLTEMIDRLLHWGRMEAGRRIYDRTAQPVAAIIDGALAAFSPQLIQSPAVIESDVPSDLPLVRVDREALVEALLNLLHNAHRYTGPDKRITVRCAARRKEVAISIGDNGPGIPKAEHRHVFDKFYRGKDSLERNLPGSGLGLAIVAHIVRAHGGRVLLESEPGRGATFTILLPSVEGKEHRGREAADHRGRPVDPARAAPEPPDRGLSAPGSA